MENLNTALTLLAIGMGTVFLILLFIINFSKLLIIMINKYVPEDVVTKKVETVKKSISGVSPKMVAAISVAINVASDGKLKAAKIEKK